MTKCSMNTRLAKSLFAYRTTPHSTGISHAELLLGRNPRTKLDRIRPNTSRRVEERQQLQKKNHDSRARIRSFRVGEAILVRNFSPGQRWLPGKIAEISGPVSYKVRLEDRRLRRCQQDQLRSRMGADEDVAVPTMEDETVPITPASAERSEVGVQEDLTLNQPTASSYQNPSDTISEHLKFERSKRASLPTSTTESKGTFRTRSLTMNCKYQFIMHA